MIPIFYVLVSVGATALLCLVGGAIGGIRLWNRYVRALSDVMSLDKHRNTAGAAWVVDEVTKQIRDGATTDDLLKWLDKRGDELAERMKNPDVGADLAVAMCSDHSPDPEAT